MGLSKNHNQLLCDAHPGLNLTKIVLFLDSLFLPVQIAINSELDGNLCCAAERIFTYIFNHL